MKIKATILSLIFAVSLLAGCGAKETAKAPAKEPAKTADAVTSASIVDNNAAFEKAISKEGTWIIATTKDLTFDKELVLDGNFKNGKKDANGNDIIQRKIALYAQDDKRNVTARYTLKAPKLTVKSENARIQGGTFVGDVYVEAKNFSIVDAKVQGNVYFANEEAKSTFKLENGGTVTGVTELKK
ncbi:hypothetical protein [Fonticella tunisiensis]|uniref:Polymer-forming protein n=1 Tax=Fonticella tunisiensis TaxID=1096341 RepID=A0A4R7KDF7_9CLOT|nr:hypothetical protein [Fonticella tunisiensis]TDT52005.1 hypothetical protein EDD71_11536 [Fonticella tunisiensis]